MRYLTAEKIKEDKGEEIKKEFEDYRGLSSDRLGLPLTEKYCSFLGKSKADIKFLELGAGSGYFCLDLYKDGFREIYGLDIDNYLNQEVLGSNIFKDFRKLDLSWDKLPWPDNYFDLAAAWCVLPHLENPHNCLREAHRVLRPGGIFIVSMPHIASLRARKIFFKTGDLIRYTDKNNHISVFTFQIFKNVALRYFNLIDIEYYVHPGIYKGRFGRVKKFGLERQWRLAGKFKEWFGANIIYVLRKGEQRHL